jgi:hypothetical protein
MYRSAWELRGQLFMQLEKTLTLIAIIVAGLLTFVFLLDLALGIPFGRANLVLDILFVGAGGMILWQGWETLREFA